MADRKAPNGTTRPRATGAPVGGGARPPPRREISADAKAHEFGSGQHEVASIENSRRAWQPRWSSGGRANGDGNGEQSSSSPSSPACSSASTSPLGRSAPAGLETCSAAGQKSGEPRARERSEGVSVSGAPNSAATRRDRARNSAAAAAAGVGVLAARKGQRAAANSARAADGSGRERQSTAQPPRSLVRLLAVIAYTIMLAAVACSGGLLLLRCCSSPAVASSARFPCRWLPAHLRGPGSSFGPQHGGGGGSSESSELWAQLRAAAAAIGWRAGSAAAEAGGGDFGGSWRRGGGSGGGTCSEAAAAAASERNAASAALRALPRQRIALFSASFDYNLDGVALTLNRLVCHLLAEGHAVAVFAPTRSPRLIPPPLPGPAEGAGAASSCAGVGDEEGGGPRRWPVGEFVQAVAASVRCPIFKECAAAQARPRPPARLRPRPPWCERGCRLGWAARCDARPPAGSAARPPRAPRARLAAAGCPGAGLRAALRARPHTTA